MTVAMLMSLSIGRALAGETATAVATITAGFVSGITVTSGGSGYTSEPAVTLSGGGGSGATAKAILSGDKVALTLVLTAGSGYSTAPTVVIEAPPKPLGVKLEMVPKLTVEAKAAEEKALAEAKAKVEAAETALASKLGLSKPFVAGVRGQAGDLAVRWIPSGRFTMGSPSSEPGRDSDEEQHQVVLTRGFFLAETECTQAQWVAIMESNKSIFKLSDRPVECVSWEEAIEYCWKLTLKQRSDGLLPEGWEWRLPTESEWEYAARGGETGPRHGQLDTIGWYDGNSGSQTHPVKQKAANAWGLHDMLGNVSEWCSDWHVSYPSGSVMDPTGTGSGSLRVFRGGGWYYDDRDARSAFRGRDVPGLRHFSLGFRPALSSVR